MDFQDSDYISYYHGMEQKPIAEPDKRHNENGIYYLVLYYILKKINGTLNNDDIDTFVKITKNIQTYNSKGEQVPGLYDRGAKESLNPDKSKIRSISHDNLNAIACFSYIMNLQFHKEIKEHGDKSLWRFDNINPDKPSWMYIMHPRDVVMWSYLAGSWWAPFFMWLVMIDSILGCYIQYERRPTLFTQIVEFIKTGIWREQGAEFVSTSGKLLAFTRLYTLRNTWYGKISWKICTYFVNKYFSGGWKEVFCFYFKFQECPIDLLISEIYVKNPKIF